MEKRKNQGKKEKKIKNTVFVLKNLKVNKQSIANFHLKEVAHEALLICNPLAQQLAKQKQI